MTRVLKVKGPSPLHVRRICPGKLDFRLTCTPLLGRDFPGVFRKLLFFMALLLQTRDDC